MREKLKKIVPKKAVYVVRSIQEMMSRSMVGVMSRNGFLSELYYLLFRGFSNEKIAVLKGRRAYYKSLRNIENSCALLRRNTHRIEKGLVMKPRKDIFAERFILETVECYKAAMQSASLLAPEKKWATDVLEEYFQAVGSSKIIDKAREEYLSTESFRRNLQLDTNEQFPNNDGKFSPYNHDLLPKDLISFQDLRTLFVRRRSVRWFSDRPIELNLIEDAVNAARFAPSACNRQPYRFLFCKNKDKAIEIAKCAGGTTGFANNIPAIFVVVGDLSAYPHERDRHVIYIDGSLATMQLMLALEALGLSSCPINWPDIVRNEKKIRRIIKLEDHERIIMLLAVGYADPEGGIPYSQKINSELLLKEIE